MRLIRILVSDEQVESLLDLLEEEGIDHVRQRAWVEDEEGWIVECPVPTDAVGYLLERVAETGIDTDRYTTVSSLEAAMVPQAEPLQERFANDFDPLSRPELRSKVRDLSRDTRSFLAMIALSAIIAVAGLLVDSPAVVVGSMVIAPVVGPVLTAAVGAVTADREMLIKSLWLQGGGLAVAVVAAGTFAFGLQWSGVFPATLDVTSIELIAVRIAPNSVTLVIGLAAGAAGAYGLSTKGPTALVGVMIAAALIPAAATVGVAAVWNEVTVAVGSALLLLLTMIAINVGAVVVLWGLRYRPEREGWLLAAESSRARLAVLVTGLALLALVGFVVVGSVQQLVYERTVNDVVERTLGESEYDGVSPVSVRTQYAGLDPFTPLETVTVTASRPADGEPPPNLSHVLADRIAAATGSEADVRVRFIEYQEARGARPNSLLNATRVDTARPRVPERAGVAGLGLPASVPSVGRVN